MIHMLRRNPRWCPFFPKISGHFFAAKNRRNNLGHSLDRRNDRGPDRIAYDDRHGQ